MHSNRIREIIIYQRQCKMKSDTHLRLFCLLLVLAAAVPAVQAAITVDAGGDLTVAAGEPVIIAAVYNDTDVADEANRSATINWTVMETAATVVPDDDYNGTVSGDYTYLTAGTYTVVVEVDNALAGTSGWDTVNVTVNPQTAETKIVPRTLNLKSNGVMTVFINIAQWFGFMDTSDTEAMVSDFESFQLANATPERVHFTMKDGGTLMLKFRRNNLDLAPGDSQATVQGNVTTADGPLSVAGDDAITVINPGNGKKNSEKGDDEKVNGKSVKDDSTSPNGKAVGQQS
jgi:hypothetical protein